MMIAERNQIPADTPKLIFRKKQIHNNKTVSYYKMKTSGSIVFMINDASPTIAMAGTEITPHAPAHNHNQSETHPPSKSHYRPKQLGTRTALA
jgi:hypothetical protein